MFDVGAKLGPVRTVAEPGPWNNSIVPLDDAHFLVLGDQEPMRISRVSAAGEVVWRKDFSKKWVLPTGAAMENGSACIVAGNYSSNGLHLFRIDRAGLIQHRLEVDSREGMVSVGAADTCVLLHGRSKDFKTVDFSLTSFDSNLRQQWTAHVPAAALWGAPYHLLTLADGYLLCTDVADGMFIAKYDFRGQVIWSGIDSTRHAPSRAVASGEYFYFVRFLDVIRGK
jgi:hypothetical protein